MAEGNLYIVSAPSGAGKTSLVNRFVEIDKQTVISISHTTRAIRPGEKDGVNYHFVDNTAFRGMIDRGDFLEYAEVFDNFYGTSNSCIQQQLVEGLDIILEIDWQGARQVRQKIRNTTGIFILPPSRNTLRRRLIDRGQDSEDIITRRMQDAVSESSHFDEYDYLIINDDFDTALQELAAVFRAQRLRLSRQCKRHAPMINDLLRVLS